MTATVTDIRDHVRKLPAWSPTLKRHAWEDVVPGHRCVHCGVCYHSEEIDGVWWKAWTLGERSGRTRKMPPCPGPQRRHLELVPPPGESPPLESPVRPCCRCVPPLPACDQPTRLYLAGWLCDWQAGITSGGAV